jgi:glutamine synthetase
VIGALGKFGSNFSTKAMRQDGGLEVINKACEQLGKFHNAHMRVYGANNDKRLTGKHETCSYKQFRYGVSDRGASIRIPMATANAKKGYLEDRRPAANLDPYQIATALIETTCGEGFNPDKYHWENFKPEA